MSSMLDLDLKERVRTAVDLGRRRWSVVDVGPQGAFARCAMSLARRSIAIADGQSRTPNLEVLGL